MKAVSVIYRKITKAEFNAISNIVTQQNGGGQTYIDFPKGSISDEQMTLFLGAGTPVSTSSYSGYEWNFKVHSLGLNIVQDATISVRRNSSNSLRNQQFGNRIKVFEPSNGFPRNDYDETNNPITIFILKDEDGKFWAGWFYQNSYSETTWFVNRKLASIWDNNSGYIDFDDAIPFSSDEVHWPFKSNLLNKDSVSENSHKPKNPLQIIYFGAPGTGKSHTIKGNAVITDDNSRRTTFHPDCDYSTFVGCYKPVTRELTAHHAKATLAELTAEAQSIVSRPVGDKVNLIIDFVTKYAHQISEIAESDSSINSLNTLLNQTFGFSNETYLAKVIFKTLETEPKDSEIVYEFQPQAFTEAYIEAWKDLDRPFFLIIEEINRGNCAQIFGDIFQLLDRDENGYSSYKTTPDRDLQQYLAANMTDATTTDAAIKNGTKMVLPPNLYIWATMNTSDQSLFPIDSAFKRRWEWRYIPIDTTDKGHYIKCGEGCYKWSDFIKAVNERIESATNSEDKKLGYWFLARQGENEISESKFVSKVVFYLWNDIYKDITRGNTIFNDSYKKFHNFFRLDGTVKTEVLADFLNGLGLESKPLPALPAPSDKGEKHVYHYNGKDYGSMTDLAVDFISDYIESHSDQTLDSIKLDLNGLRSNLIPAEKKNAREITVRNGEPLFVTNLWDQDRFKAFMDAVNEKGIAEISED